MIAFSDVEDFVQRVRRVTEREELGTMLSDAVGVLGFDHCALVHHTSRPEPDSVQYVDYPEAFQALSVERNYFAEDPVLAACQASAAAFRWSDLPRLILLTDRQREILEAALSCGLGEGFTIPVNVPGELPGSCSFAVRTGRELPIPVLPASQYMGCFAFEAARRVRKTQQVREAREAVERPRLTGRQLDCLVLAAQGKSDWAIAQLLGISGETVHQHIETAKRRYGVASRMQLVVRALYDNVITFADTLGGPRG
ncbi:MAG TPA: LuxR family transcriptional regulator [Phenylobacterium sp.]